MDKREMIERALGEHLWSSGLILGHDTLAEQAIVIECEVEHGYLGISGKPYTNVIVYDIGAHIMDGHHGTPGKAIAIILSLEEE